MNKLRVPSGRRRLGARDLRRPVPIESVESLAADPARLQKVCAQCKTRPGRSTNCNAAARSTLDDAGCMGRDAVQPPAFPGRRSRLDKAANERRRDHRPLPWMCFSRYIDSGFGLLGGEVRFSRPHWWSSTSRWRGLFWAWGRRDDVLARLVKKVILYVGRSPTSSGNFNQLAGIDVPVLPAASGSRPRDRHDGRRIAPAGRQVGIDAGDAHRKAAGDLMGFPEVFNLGREFCAVHGADDRLGVIGGFAFGLSRSDIRHAAGVQIDHARGLVLVPFSHCGTRPVSWQRCWSGVVILWHQGTVVLAVIVGIGSERCLQVTAPGAEPIHRQPLVIMLAALCHCWALKSSRAGDRDGG